jgi:transcription elongation GreA/GreB family factor
VLIDEEAAAASDKVSVGSRVTIDRDDGERMDVEISSVGGVSPDSPPGKALIGTKSATKSSSRRPGEPGALAFPRSAATLAPPHRSDHAGLLQRPG